MAKNSNNPTVVFHNNFNKIPLKPLSEMERNLMFALMHKMKEKKGETIEFSIKYLQKILNKTANYSEEQTWEIIEKLENNFFHLSLKKISDDGEWIDREHLFTTFSIHKDKTAIKLKINPAFQYIVNDLVKDFTKFELEEFFYINGKYAKDLYKNLKQWRKKGCVQWSWEYFKEMLCIPETYRQRDIDTRILKPAVKELMRPLDLFDTVRQPFKNLKYEKIKGKGRGRGGKVIGIKFTFDPEIIPQVVGPEEEFHLEPLTQADLDLMNQNLSD